MPSRDSDLANEPVGADEWQSGGRVTADRALTIGLDCSLYELSGGKCAIAPTLQCDHCFICGLGAARPRPFPVPFAAEVRGLHFRHIGPRRSEFSTLQLA
jgi:hypothetical protein